MKDWLGEARGRVAVSLSDLTDGERWTMGLVVIVMALFLSFGLRQGKDPVAPFAAAATPPASPTVPSDPPSVAPAEDPPLSPGPLAPDPPRPSSAGGATSSFDAAPAPPPAGEPVEVVGVVRTGDGSVAGRDDAAIAGVFLSELDVVRIVGFNEAEQQLCGPGGSRRLVLASEGLRADVRSCIVDSGSFVLSHDDLGSSDGALSTSLGAGAAFVEAARVVGPESVIGLAARPDLGPAAEAARDVLEAEGFTVRITTVGSDEPSVVAAMLGFVVDDVDTVVFGTDVAHQARWLSLAAALRMPFDHVVADVGDSISNEAYPDEALGIRAVAATRVQWFAREHGETDAQRDCRQRFESAIGADVGSAGELARVYLWCQHVAIASQFLDAGLDTGALRQPFESPMTSSVVGATETGFGPRDVAVLQWKAECSCWAESRPFEPRRGAP